MSSLKIIVAVLHLAFTICTKLNTVFHSRIKLQILIELTANAGRDYHPASIIFSSFDCAAKTVNFQLASSNSRYRHDTLRVKKRTNTQLFGNFFGRIQADNFSTNKHDRRRHV